MKTILPQDITTAQEATDFINALCDNGEMFHFDDPADDIINTETGLRLFTDEEAAKVDELVGKCFELLEDPFEIAMSRLEH